jgi:hypothetical protein
MVSEEISERVRIVRHETLRRTGGEEVVLYRGERGYLLLNHDAGRGCAETDVPSSTFLWTSGVPTRAPFSRQDLRVVDRHPNDPEGAKAMPSSRIHSGGPVVAGRGKATLERGSHRTTRDYQVRASTATDGSPVTDAERRGALRDRSGPAWVFGPCRVKAGGDMTLCVSEAFRGDLEFTPGSVVGDRGNCLPRRKTEVVVPSVGYKRCLMSPPSSRPSTRSDPLSNWQGAERVGSTYPPVLRGRDATQGCYEQPWDESAK